MLFAPCPAALAALGSALDPHACCHKSDEAPASPGAQECETMCARAEAERAVLVAPPADGAAPAPPTPRPIQVESVVVAPLPNDSSPPGAADIRLLACTFLI